MRTLPIIILAVLTLTTTFPGAAQDGITAEEAGQVAVTAGIQEALDRLRAEQRGQADPNETSSLDHLDRWVLQRSTLPTDEVRETFQEARNASGHQARTALLEAEAAALGLSYQNARRSVTDGDAANASAWGRAVIEAVDWRAYDLVPSTIQHEVYQDEENVTEAIDGALAIRARQAVLEAWLLDRTGHADAAQATADGAEALVGLLVPEAADRLPPGLRASLTGNATGIAQAVASVPEDPPRGHVLPGLVAPLTALELNRVIEPLNELGARTADLPAVAARAAEHGDPLAGELAEAAWRWYGADRGRLLLMGEGSGQALDSAFQGFWNASQEGDVEAMRRAAGQARAAMTEVALLERGSVLKVETGGVQPGRIHDYKVTLVYPPLEGIARYELSVESDPGIVEITEAHNLLDGRFTQARDGGVVTFSNELDEPLRRSARIAHLHLNATGPPEMTTNLTILEATFLEPDGDPVPLFRLRHGHATVANITQQADPAGTVDGPGDPDAVQTPLGPFAGLAALLGASLLAHRRRHR